MSGQNTDLDDVLDEIRRDVSVLLDSSPEVVVSLIVVKNGSVEVTRDGAMAVVPDRTGNPPTAMVRLLRPLKSEERSGRG